MKIPRIIHQTYSSLDALSPELQNNISKLAKLNPEWTLKFYSDDDIVNFIKSEYDEVIYKSYLSINPTYGAARADLFRYLVVYRLGGLYLDIKSTVTKPLNSVIFPDDVIITSTWPDSIDGVDTSKMGVHEELEFREYQNWFICAAPNSEVLEHVIYSVCQNIRNYRPLRDGVGQMGVLRTTGPIAYSKILHPYVVSGRVRIASNAELGFRYTVFDFGSKAHHSKSLRHYGLLNSPVIYRSKIHSLLVGCYFRLKKFIDKVRERFRNYRTKRIEN